LHLFRDTLLFFFRPKKCAQFLFRTCEISAAGAHALLKYLQIFKLTFFRHVMTMNNVNLAGCLEGRKVFFSISLFCELKSLKAAFAKCRHTHRATNQNKFN